MEPLYIGLITVASIISAIAIAWFIGSWRRLNKEEALEHERSNGLTEEDKILQAKLPTLDNVEYLVLQEIPTPFVIDKGEIALAHLNIETVSTVQRHREIGGGTGNVRFLGFSMGMSKRKISQAYEHVETKVKRTLVTNNKLYVDTDDRLFVWNIGSIILVEFVGNMTVRMLHKKNKGGVFFKFKNEEELIKFMRLYYTHRSIGRLSNKGGS